MSKYDHLAPSKSYHPVDNNNNSLDYYNHNHPSYDPSRTTIIVPNCEIIVPNSNSLDIAPTKLSSHASINNYHGLNKGPCDRCHSETQNYIDIVRNEIARTVELQSAKGEIFVLNKYKKF